MRNIPYFLDPSIRVFYLVLLLIISESFKTDAQYVDCSLKNIDDREFRIFTPEDIIKKRLEIIKAIWNTDQIPDRCDVIGGWV